MPASDHMQQDLSATKTCFENIYRPHTQVMEHAIAATKYVFPVHGHLATPAFSSTLLEPFLEAFEQFLDLLSLR